MKTFKLLAAAALVLGVGIAAEPAEAVPYGGTYVLENGVNLWNGIVTPDLTSIDNSDEGIQDVIDANSDLFGVPVDFVGRLEFDDDEFTAEDETHGFAAIGLLSATCTEFKGDDCVGFEWFFDRSSLPTDWEIVKISVKGGNLDRGGYDAAWALDPFANIDTDLAGEIVHGFFSCATLVQAVDGDEDDCEGGPLLKGISHIDFYGTANEGTIPEPMTLGLLGLGLLGLGYTRRRLAA